MSLRLVISNEYLFFPIDVIDFSRGSTTGSDFINQINNENYWQVGLLPRSHLMFDPVGSYQIPGNGIDLGRDFSTPKNIIAIQINAANETRNLFDLQNLYTSTGQNPNPRNWQQITLPGTHSDIGGGNKKLEQGKDQDMAFYSMQTMINAAQGYGINFKPIPDNQKPSFEFNTAINYYFDAQNSYNNNPNDENKIHLENISSFIQQRYINDSTFSGSGKIYNYSIGNERGVFYPNDRYLNK